MDSVCPPPSPLPLRDEKETLTMELSVLNSKNANAAMQFARKTCKNVGDIANNQIAREIVTSAIRLHGVAINSATDDATLLQVLDSLVILPESACFLSSEGVEAHFSKDGIVYMQSAWYLPLLSEHLDRGSSFPKGWTNRRCFVIKDGSRVAVGDEDFRKIHFDDFKGVHVCGDIEFPSGQILIDFVTE